ncbi:MAG: nitrilase-related carbon-nitrogen hydrolase [Myxococcota bacterium]
MKLGLKRCLRLGLLAWMAGSWKPAQAQVGLHRVSGVQYRMEGDASPERIITRVRRHILGAKNEQAELVVFPELFVLDAWPTRSSKSEAEITRSIAGRVTPTVWAAIQTFAKAFGISVLAGSAPELRDGRLYNTARLFFSDGRVEVQDKLKPTAWGRGVGVTPGKSLNVFEAPWGRSVVLICYDVEFPDLSAALARRRPEVILVPSMTESEAGRDRVRWTAQARAVEHHAYVVVVPTTGQPTPSWQHFGRVIFLGPQDGGQASLLYTAPFGRDDVFTVTLDLAALRQSRETTKFYPARDMYR